MQQNKTVICKLIIQFENAIQPPQWNAPVLLMRADIVTDENSVVLYQPAFSERPAAASDISEEMLAYMNQRLSAVGLTVARTPNAAE